MKPFTPFLLVLSVVTASCTPRAPAAPVPVVSLAAVLDSIADRPPLHRTLWGIAVADAETGELLYARNLERNFIPASNTKLVVGIVALGTLGPDWRYRTPVLAAGRSGDSAVAIVLAGTGDPTWSSRYHGDTRVMLDSLASLVAMSGVRRTAELVIDASRFRDALVHSAWEVGDLPWQYAPPIDAAAAGEGVFRIVIRGGAAPGGPVTIENLTPLPQPLRLEVATDTAGARAVLAVDYTARRDTVYITGSVGAGAADTSTLALTRPAESLGAALAAALEQRGVRIGTVRVERDSAAAAALRMGAAPIAEWASPPMRDIVAGILRPSQNWIAEQVVKTLGAELRGDGSWRGGVAAELDYLYGPVGLDTGAVNLRDASGMSPQNLLSPATTLALLRHARAAPWAADWRNALAAPGRTGSTLSTRLRPLEGRLEGKTGTISNVATLSGYLRTDRGRELVFAIYTNGTGLPSATVRSAVDAMMLEIARHADAGRPVHGVER